MIKRMRHIYQMYRFVKMVEEENIKNAEKSITEMAHSNGTWLTKIYYFTDTEAIQKFGTKQFLLIGHKLGTMKASRVANAAVANKYLGKLTTDDKTTFYVTQGKF